METPLMQPSYRTIFTEILIAEAAAAVAFADVTARFASLLADEYRATLETRARPTQPKVENTGPAQPGSFAPGALPAASASFYRALAGLPRMSVMTFLSQYDGLRRSRGEVRN